MNRTELLEPAHSKVKVTANARILHVIPNSDFRTGGLEYASIRLAHEQAREGLLVYIMEVKQSIRAQASWWCKSVKYINHDSSLGSFRNLLLFRRFLLEFNPIVHFHGVWSHRYIPYFILVMLSKSFFIVSPHGSFEAGALRQKFFKKYIARKLFLNHILRKATELWACSQKEYNSLKREFPKIPVTVVPIGIDIPDKIDRYVDNGHRQSKVILVISRLTHGKGLLNLVKAWSFIRDDDWRIVLAGPDSEGYKKIIEREISHLNLERFFSFTGYVDNDQRDALYRSADFFVLPSLSENFGIVIAEALSFGLPVLTTNETPWGYVGLERGCLCVDTNPNALSSGLRVLMGLTKSEKVNLANAGRSFVLENFSWKSIVKISINRIATIKEIEG